MNISVTLQQHRNLLPQSALAGKKKKESAITYIINASS